MNEKLIVILIVASLLVGVLVGFGLSDAYVYQPFKTSAVYEYQLLNERAFNVIKDYNNQLNNCVNYALSLENVIKEGGNWFEFEGELLLL